MATGLIHFRSPLLAESRLMSFPPGTEMFQFPGFASPTYVFSERYPIGVGCPIRTPRDQSLLAAPPGFSQRATSFIASWCQGIHQMPFSCSNIPLVPPCTGTTNTPGQKPPSRRPTQTQRKHSVLNSTQHITNAPEPCSAPTRAAKKTGSDKHSQPRRHGPPTPPEQAATHGAPRKDPSRPARPEAYQNLIHTCQRPLQRPCPGPALQRSPAHTAPNPNLSTTSTLASCPIPSRQVPAANSQTRKQRNSLEADGIEPTTPCLQSRCSPS